MKTDPDFDLSLAERYARYLFDSMPGIPGIYYRNHNWHHCELRFETEDGYELRVPITLSDTHHSVEKKLRAAYAKSLSESEMEPAFGAERGLFFHLLY